jgi:hypothetical protein
MKKLLTLFDTVTALNVYSQNKSHFGLHPEFDLRIR